MRRGLLTLARMPAAGWVVPPWKLGLRLADSRDTFDDDMGLVDAFRLWGMSAFDDRDTLEAFLTSKGVPGEWAVWAREQFPVE